MMQQLVCPQCMATIPSEKSNFDDSVVVCPNCLCTFDRIRSQAVALKPKSQTIPKRVRVHQQGDDLLFIVKWRDWAAVLQRLPVAAVWTLVSGLIFISTLVMAGATALFIIPFMVVGLYMLYQCALNLFNETRIWVDTDKFRIKNVPVPPVQSHQLRSADVVDVYYREHYTHGVRIKGRIIRPYDYDVWIVLRDGSEHCILNTNDEAAAIYVSQRIKYALNLPDNPEKPDVFLADERALNAYLNQEN